MSGSWAREPNSPSGRPGGLSELSELVEWQRQELSRLHERIVARSVSDLATGILMERFGWPAAEAEAQLKSLAADAQVSTAELGSEIAGIPRPRVPVQADREAGPAPVLADYAAVGGRAWVSLRGAADAGRIARALLDETLADEGANALAIWLIAPDGGLELGGEAGFGPQEAARWQRVPPGFRTPAARAARGGAEIWWPSGRPADEELPVIGGLAGGARAILPLQRLGVSIGALEMRWSSPVMEFPARTRQKLEMLGEVCVQALSLGGPAPADYSTAWIHGLLDGLHDSALIARPLADAGRPAHALMIEWASTLFADPAGRSLADIVGHQLLEIYPETARPGGLYDAAQRVIDTGQPERLENAALIASSELTAEVRIAPLCDGVVISWRLSSEADLLAALLDMVQHLGRIGSWEEDLRTGDMLWTDQALDLLSRPPGSPVHLEDLHKHVLAEDRPAVLAFRHRLIREHQSATAAFRVVRDDDESVRQLRASAVPVIDPAGELVAVRGAYEDISPQLHAQMAFDATREQLTGAQEREAEERELAIRLQQAITPQASQFVASAGLDVAARYRPAGIGSLVGGDWYDAVVLPDKQVLLAVGDVASHGLDAVTGMVALRNYLRGLAVTGAGPAQLLSWLNGAACQPAEGIFATAICALYDPASRTLRWARAGHPPPLLVRDGTARSLPLPSGMALGVHGEASYSESRVRLQFGDVLLMFTDGLVESRVVPLDDSLAQLRQRASRQVLDVGEFAGELLAGSLADTGDDACLLAVSFG